MKSFTSNVVFVIISIVTCCTGLVGLLWSKEFQSLQNDQQLVIEQAVQRNTNLALALENYTIRTLQNADLVLQIVKKEFETKQRISNYQQLLSQASVDQTLYNGIAIINENGKPVSSTIDFSKDTTLNFSDRDYFRFHATHTDDAFFINKPVHSKLLGKGVIPISRRINKSDGSFGGAVVLLIVHSNLTSFYEKAVVNAQDIVSLIAPDGTTYTRQTGSVPSYGENISKSPLFIHLRQQSTGSYFAKDAIRNIPTYFSYRKLANYPIIATVGITENDILRDFNARKKREILFTCGISLLILLFALLASVGILHRRKYLRLLMENEEKYRLMFENSRDAIILSTIEGDVIALNPSACNLFKLDPGQAKLGNIHSWMQANNNGSTSGNSELLNGEIEFTDQQGGKFTGEVHAASYMSNSKRKVIVSVIRDTTERNRLLTELNNEKNNRQQLIMKQVIQAQERERTIIGGELHDNVCQILSGVKIYLTLVDKNNERAKEFLPKTIEFVDTAIVEIRNLSHALSSPTLGKKSLLASITDLVADTSISSGVKIAFTASTGTDAISIEQKLAIFRIVQEQISNIVKHAEASAATVTLQKNTHETVLTIADNGKGFTPGEYQRGIGLNNIEARVKAFSGSFKITAAPGQGCTIEASFPQEAS